LLYVRFISAADKAGGGVRKGVRKRNIYVYAQNKKEENFGRIEILPICSKKRVCAKTVLEEFPIYKY
jgi:hypothetical protein